MWNNYLTEGLHKIGFTQSKIDQCIFWQQSTLIIIYTNDTILSGPNDTKIQQVTEDICTLF